MDTSCFAFYGNTLIKTTPTGELDLEASKRMLRRLVSADEAVACAVVFDLRGVTCPLRSDALNELIDEFGRIDRVFIGKIAILLDGYDREQPVPSVRASPDGRYQAAHFVDFDEVMHWLTLSTDREEKTPQPSEDEHTRHVES